MINTSFVLNLLFSFLLVGLSSCAKEVVKLETKRIQERDGLAMISFGPLCQPETIEGKVVKKSSKTVLVEPGRVKLSVSYTGEIIGDMVYYTDEPVNLWLCTKPGRKYKITGEPGYPSTFRVKVVENELGEVLLSDPVELKVKWIIRRKN